MGRKWTIEKCKEDALKYITKKEWNDNSSAYSTAKNNGWIDECCNYMKPLGSKYKRLIYAFEFPDKSVYVGLTYNSEERRKNHLISKKSRVYKHILKTNLLPEFKELTNYMNSEMASIAEGEILNQYKFDGWVILNVKKTGGLGGDSLIWNKEKCLSNAQIYSNRSDWARKSSGAYESARKNNWLDECCMHMKNKIHLKNFWTKENCMNVALKYSYQREWRKNSSASYSIATKKSWLKDCCKHMIHNMNKPNGYWTKENCMNEAKKFKKRSEFRKISNGAYESARKNNWLNEICNY